jgi:hypothetical protein
MLQLCKAAVIISGSWNKFMNLEDLSGRSTKYILFVFGATAPDGDRASLTTNSTQPNITEWRNKRKFESL